MKIMTISLLMLLVGCSPSVDLESLNTPLEGVWKLTAAEVHAPNGQIFPSNPQESLLLFAGNYYSMNWATGELPAPFSAEQLRPTDAEKLARFSTLIVNAGHFELSEDELTIHPDFAMLPEYVGGLGVFNYELDGDALYLEWHTIESVDGISDPNTAQGVVFNYEFTRQ